MTVYAVAMFLVYTWTLYTSFWKLPSWLFFLNLGEIVSIYSYAFLVNFLESILLLSVVLLVGLVMPRRWWTEAFTARASVFILVILGSAVLHLSRYPSPDTRAIFINAQLLWWLVTLLVAVLCTWIAGNVEAVRRSVEDLAERFLVFLYVYGPLTVAAVLILLVRFLV